MLNLSAAFSFQARDKREKEVAGGYSILRVV